MIVFVGFFEGLAVAVTLLAPCIWPRPAELQRQDCTSVNLCHPCAGQKGCVGGLIPRWQMPFHLEHITERM